MALRPTTTFHPHNRPTAAFPGSLLTLGGQARDQVARTPADFPSAECSPLLYTLLSFRHDQLGGFSIEDVMAHTPSDDRPSHSEDLRDLKASFAALVAEVKELKSIVSGPRAPLGAPPRQPSAQSKPSPKRKPPATPRALAKPASTPPSRPSFASAAQAPARPSLVIRAAATQTSDGGAILAVQRSPQEVISYLNGALAPSPHPVTLSAARWTGKHNLVVTAGPDTTAHHLASSSRFISDALTPFLSLDHSSPISISIRENVKWSRILINNIPTGVSNTRGPYSPSECHEALTVHNPVYRTLHLTQNPSWVRKPSTYSQGSSSSLVVAFEDPDGSALRALLAGRSLYAFGHEGVVKRWKEKPRVKTYGDRL
jgi:hypothetical protein